jgi:hypothetical protein
MQLYLNLVKELHTAVLFPGGEIIHQWQFSIQTIKLIYTSYSSQNLFFDLNRNNTPGDKECQV